MVVHYANPIWSKTPCGIYCLDEDGEVLREVDSDIEQVSCKKCLRSRASDGNPQGGNEVPGEA